MLQKHRGPQLFEAPVETKEIDISEKFYLKGAEVTATAEQLNNAGEGGGTTASAAMVPVVQAEDTDTARGLLGAAAEADLATKADAADLDGKANLEGAQTFSGAQRTSTTTLTSVSASVAVDMSLNNDFALTTTENTTLANPTNAVAGQKGRIVITQGATARTMAFGSYYKFPGGTDPALTTTAGAIDVLFYEVKSSTEILCNLVKAFA